MAKPLRNCSSKVITLATDDSSKAQDSEPNAMLDPDDAPTEMVDNDQRFLLFFISGTFFGPDLKGESPQKSILQRIAEGLPPYTSDQLVGSHMKILEIEQIFRYVLGKADQSVIVKSSLLRQFFLGNLPKHGDDPTANYPQFPDLFPPVLHPHSQLSYQNMIVENISIVRKPETFYIDQDDIKRFRRLSGREDFLVDEEASRLCTTDGSASQNAADFDVQEPNEELSPFSSAGKCKKMRRMDELLELDDPLQHEHVMTHIGSDPDERAGPAMVLLPSFPTKSELSNIVAATKSGYALTGSAAKGKVGSSIGLLDIGECNDSYLFRISLPGVKRDARDFSCEVESDGKVLIRGVTSAGEKTVYRYSHMFEMQTQNLCPPGRFSISFKLPGPVDPQQFSGNFGTDGILEGIVMKDREMAGR